MSVSQPTQFAPEGRGKMLQLQFILHEHGWATVSIGDGQVKVELEGSYLSDALGDLARAARGILRGLPEVNFSFQQEPGEHRIVVAYDGKAVRLQVYNFPDTFSKLNRGKLVLTANCSLREFANECINCLRHVLDEFGETGYAQRWKNHSFPSREYQDLLALRRELTSNPTAALDRSSE